MRFLLLNQTFYPDVASTAQHLSDLALGLVKRGHQVTVLTSQRAYDDPGKLFPRQETWRGVRIIRIGSTGFGKAARWRRAADFASFLAVGCLRLAFLPRHDAVVALTSPPLISFLGAWLARLRGSRFFYWVMDFNPDEAIAAGWLRPDSLAAKVLDRMSRFSLRQATKVIALDRFMHERIVAKGIAPEKVVVLPPWSHDNAVRFDAAGRERFRQQHGLEHKFVVMYSGNHSPCHPLDTLLAAARRLAEDPEVVFCFIGGGSEWKKIQRMQKDEGRMQKSENGTHAARSPPPRSPPALSAVPAAGRALRFPFRRRPARGRDGRPVPGPGASLQGLQHPERGSPGAVYRPAAQPCDRHLRERTLAAQFRRVLPSLRPGGAR